MELAKSILEALLLGLSLSADCFAVSLCSSVAMTSPEKRRTASLAIAFAVIQTAFLLCGWLLGHVFTTFLESRLAHFELISSVTAFILLMFVSVEMFISAARGKTEKINLSSVRNIIIGAVATSIDALTVGISLAFAGPGSAADGMSAASSSASFAEMLLPAAAVFVTTAAAVVAGILSGSTLGRNYGRTAVFTGASILALIALSVLL